MNSDNKLFKLCYNLLNKYDNVWMKRKRKLDTKTIFEYLINGAITNTGISTCVNVQQQFSHVAMIKARQKIGETCFSDINKTLHKEETLQNHVYAIDGSKVQVHNCFKELGYKTRTCDKVKRRMSWQSQLNR